MHLLILVLVAAAGSAFVIWLQKRHSSELYRQIVKVHEARLGFWRKRVQMKDADEERASALRFQADQTAMAYKRELEKLRDSFREQAMPLGYGDTAYDEEHRAMIAAMSRTTPDDDEVRTARGYISMAGRAATQAQKQAAGVVDWRTLAIHAGMGMFMGAYTGFALARRVNRGDEIPNFPWADWVLGGLLAGAMIAMFAPESFWSWTRRRWKGVAVGVAVYTVVLGLRAMDAASERSVLAALVAESHCPREDVPAADNSMAPRLSPEQLCAVVWRAGSVLPDEPATHAYLTSGDARGVHVVGLADRERPDGSRVWHVGFALTSGDAMIYWVAVEQATGKAALVGG